MMKVMDTYRSKLMENMRNQESVLDKLRVSVPLSRIGPLIHDLDM